jgi:hypothetical protein
LIKSVWLVIPLHTALLLVLVVERPQTVQIHHLAALLRLAVVAAVQTYSLAVLVVGLDLPVDQVAAVEHPA